MDTKERARIATAAATRARRMTKWRRWATEMRENGFSVREPRGSGEVASTAELEHWAAVLRCAGYWVTDPEPDKRETGPLPLSVGRIPSYCGRVDKPHAGHVWTTQTGRWCPGDETR